MSNKDNDIDLLLKGLLGENLRELFNKRVYELNTNQTAVQNLLGIQYRTLNGILDGSQKRVNYSAFDKLAAFLNMPTERLIEIHLSQLDRQHQFSETPTGKKNFIRENFDLASLKKAGFITDITNITEVESKIVSFLGYHNIYEYKKRMFDVAFSEGAAVAPSAKRESVREFWLTVSKSIATKLDNPYYYDRDELKRYFPHIKWHSTNVDAGFKTVIKALYKLGVTVVFLPYLPSLGLRGATFPVDGQPVIALTDYRGFYATLWHCLIHELYHTLIDWDDIRQNNYHLSEDAGESLSVDAKEAEANDFAREYLFSKDKLEEIKPYLRDTEYVNAVAKDNNIDPSIIYIYNAFDNGSTDRMAWARARRYSPDIKRAVAPVEIKWDSEMSIDERVKKLKIEIYN